MTLSASALWSVIGRYTVRAVGGPVFLGRALSVATLSVVRSLLGLADSGIALDMGRLKDTLLRKAEAEAALKEAEAHAAAADAQKKLAEAAEAANRANLPKRNDSIAKAEKQKLQADAAKTQAEADAIRVDAATRQKQALAESYARLLEVVSKLKQEGGGLIVDAGQLRELLGLPSSKEVESSKGRAGQQTRPPTSPIEERRVQHIPVTDFELSTRTRNCFKKMNVRTLGDLTRVTEQQLLRSKNFGETSLQEVKAMLASKGLRLAQPLEMGAAGGGQDLRHWPQSSLSKEQQAVLSKPVTDLNLSVRARKCMQRLGLQTFDDLIQRSADELLESKNFSMTSLKEVRDKLAVFGLALRDDFRS